MDQNDREEMEQGVLQGKSGMQATALSVLRQGLDYHLIPIH
jgi:hypothetical protein